MDNKDTMLHDHCRGYLPHIENKQYQMITFRLYDSVPKEVVEGWKETLSLLGGISIFALIASEFNPSNS